MSRVAAILVGFVTLTGVTLLCLPALAQTNRVVPTPPVPVLKSPVDSFRTLLVLPDAERQQFLATRSTNVQAQLRNKIREYQSLTKDERELRLTATELRWYLQPLMSAPTTNRAAQLALVPESLRPMVEARLEQWDQIPAPLQRLFLTNQQGAGYFARVETPTNYPPLPPMPISPKLTDRFNKLFDLTPGEKEKVLATLSDSERKQMEKTLESYEKLSLAQRRQCLASFKTFAGMSLTERQEFLRNAERWAQMSPAERQSWRELVSAAPTLPSPPIVSVPKPPLPISPRKPGPSVTTNGG